MTEFDTDRYEHEHGEDEEMGGVYIGGSMSGGAFAIGTDSTAEDSSRRERTAGAENLPAPTARPVSAPPGQFVVAGHATGGAALGDGSEAVDRSVRVSAADAELLAHLAHVRQDLRKLERTIEVDAADSELAKAEEEIKAQGPQRGVLRRLLGFFQGGSAVLREAETAAQVVETLQARGRRWTPPRATDERGGQSMTTANAVNKARWDAERQRWVRGPEVEPPLDDVRPVVPGLGLAGLSVAAVLAAASYLPFEPGEPITTAADLLPGAGSGADSGDGGGTTGGNQGAPGASGPGSDGGGAGEPGDGSAPQDASGDDGPADTDGSGGEASEPDASQTEEPGTEPSPSADSDPSEDGEAAADPAAFSLADFAGWERTEGPQDEALFTDPDDARFSLRVTWSEDAETPAEALEDDVRAPLQEEAGYTRIHLADWNDDEGWNVAEDGPHFEYTLDAGTDDEPQRGLATAFVADNGMTYTVTAIGPEAKEDRTAIEEALLDAVAGFSLTEEEPEEDWSSESGILFRYAARRSGISSAVLVQA
ncbi:hypothetical protein [Allosalinactinospora lopnorensis]|uniref:hypothetical protein n=1 Tax=Allosalinactinospora lopnorensis TaxID=1352348 RepID=UPI000695EB69|nr:hypothetical protein [Allosalinactinospora lopnorensis]